MRVQDVSSDLWAVVFFLFIHSVLDQAFLRHVPNVVRHTNDSLTGISCLVSAAFPGIRVLSHEKPEEIGNGVKRSVDRLTE